MNYAIKGAFALVVICVTTSCSAGQEPLIAASCYVINAADAEQRKLKEYFDRFANDQQLTASDGTAGQDAFGYVYSDPEKGVLMSLNLFMGQNRAVTSAYSNERINCSTCQAFNDFVLDGVGKDFKVIPCAEVEGFRQPQLRSMDLR